MASTQQQTAETDPSQDDAFQRELRWCIEQLEIGLLASKSKLPTSQTHEAVRILKVLRNPKAPYAKKRQYMRATFGDYRKKMDDETKRYAAKTKKISVKPTPAKNQKGNFLKKSSHQRQNHTSDQETSPGFCFNFDVNPESEGQENSTASPNSIKNAVPENYFRMDSSDGSFRFDFDPERKS